MPLSVPNHEQLDLGVTSQHGTVCVCDAIVFEDSIFWCPLPTTTIPPDTLPWLGSCRNELPVTAT